MIKSSFLLGLALAAPGFATQTQFFTQSSRADFEAGKLDALVVTNFGELKLARAIESVLADEGKYASIDAVAEGLDGTIYLGTNASGLLISLASDTPATLADYGESAAVSALSVTASGDVLVGVSGETAKLDILRKGSTSPELLVELPEAQYIWSIALASDGKVYVATGPAGQLYEVDPVAKTSKVLFDSDEDNLRSIVSMNDMLFVGTDPNGLILRIDRKNGKATVVYDAPESEVSTLLLDARTGYVYAGTSQLVEASGTQEPPDAIGRPAGRPAGEPIFMEPSEAPKPKPSEDAPEGELHADMVAPEQHAEQADESASPDTQPASHGPSPSGPITTIGGDEPAANGNAIYRIDSQGFVSEIFRDPTMVLAMARLDNQLLVATGPTGTLYQLDLSSEEHTAVARSRSQMLTSLLIATDKRIYVGSALSSTLSRLSAELARSGTYTSGVLDAGQIAAFGKAQIRGAIAADTAMTLSLRSSNVEDEDSPLWSAWSEPVAAARFTSVQTPPGRFLQYRLTLTGNGATSPTLEDVSIAYLQPNVAPRIDSVTVAAEPTEDGSPQPMRTITWIATEPNGDELRYAIYQRSSANSPWIQLARDLTDVTWQWDTRKLSDGRYEIKVEATDALANPTGAGKTVSRIAEPVQVDNTPPAIGDIKVSRDGGKVTVWLRVADRIGVVSRMEYSLDTDEHWQSVQPSDMLSDSPDEQYEIVLNDPGPSARVVSIRSRDESGNMAYESVTIRPENK